MARFRVGEMAGGEVLAADLLGLPLELERFDLSQRVYQKDPWAERAQPREARRFRPVADLSLEAAE